jgi:hypothetical protein
MHAHTHYYFGHTHDSAMCRTLSVQRDTLMYRERENQISEYAEGGMWWDEREQEGNCLIEFSTHIQQQQHRVWREKVLNFTAGSAHIHTQRVDLSLYQHTDSSHLSHTPRSLVSIVIRSLCGEQM